ncbi:hypothetical protein [Limnoglobus roseus]|uniref:hypothetical protein n=1 Tax=Limnoglobus roseus TaxID=2598579 RepID=UPI0011EA7FAB|nr:hypothetical protein [Limnoglobus roseus]
MVATFPVAFIFRVYFCSPIHTISDSPSQPRCDISPFASGSNTPDKRLVGSNISTLSGVGPIA